MKSLREILTIVISEAIPETQENLKFCSNEGKYEKQGFYEMMNKVMETISKHITEED